MKRQPDLLVHGDQASAKLIGKELAIYGTDKKLRERIETAIVEREENVLTALFHEIWR